MRLNLIHKLLIALFASTALVLLAMMLFMRVTIGRGFETFLHEQERTQLQTVVPELAAWYVEHDGWSDMLRDPEAFHEVIRGTLEAGQQGFQPSPRPEGRPGPGARPPPRGDQRPSGPRGRRPSGGREESGLHRRVFLLNAEEQPVVGRPPRDREVGSLLAVEVAGETVGWLGLKPAAGFNAPEEQAFIASQRRALMVGLAVALLVAGGLAWLLARHLTRPVSAVAGGIHSLAAGDYSVRVETHGHDEIARLARDVNRLAEALTEHQALQQRWMADIAHELRTPLAIISGELEAMADGVRPLNTDSLGSVREEVKQLSGLIDDLRNLALSDSGALSYRLETIDLTSLVDNVLESARPRVEAQGLELSWEGARDGVAVRGDEQRLRQLLSNLLENSRRYTDAPGKIDVSLVSGSDWAVLTVSDSAPGVSGEDCQRIFERLERLEGSRNRGTGGSGLGLSICRNIVEAHGGTIVAEPGPLGGLMIRVELPLQT